MAGKPKAVTSVDQIRKQCAALRDAQADEGELVTIDNITIRARRVTLAPYIATGRVPQRLVNLLAGREEDEADGEAREQRDISPNELFSLGAFVRAVITDSMIEPRIVFEQRPLGEGEISAFEFTQDWLNSVYQWSLHGAIATTEGEVPATALENFHQEQAGPGQPVDAGTHGQELRAAA